MLNQLLKSLSGELVDKLGSELNVDQDKIQDSISLAGDNISSGLMGAIGDGNIGSILNLFQGKESVGSSSLVSGIINNYAGDLLSKLGLPEGIANKVSKFAIPFIMEKFVGEAKEKGVNDEEGITNLLGDSATDMIKDQLKDKLGSFGNFFN